MRFFMIHSGNWFEGSLPGTWTNLPFSITYGYESMPVSVSMMIAVKFRSSIIEEILEKAEVKISSGEASLFNLLTNLVQQKVKGPGCGE